MKVRGTWKRTVRICPKDVAKCKFSNYVWRLLKVTFCDFSCRSLTFKPVLPFIKAAKENWCYYTVPPHQWLMWLVRNLCFPCVRWRNRRKGSLLLIQFLWRLSICITESFVFKRVLAEVTAPKNMYKYLCFSKTVLLCSHDQNTI